MNSLHNEHYYNGLSYLASLITGVSYLWHLLGTNQPNITAACGLIGAAIAVYSFVMQLLENRKKRKNKGLKNVNNGR